MIIKYKNGTFTDEDNFDYVIISDIDLDKNMAIQYFKKIEIEKLDLLIIKCRPDSIKIFSDFILKLSLSIKNKYLIGCVNIYSRKAYDFIKSNNDSLSGDRSNILNINIKLINNDFKVGYAKIDIKNKNRIGLKNYVALILKNGTILKYALIGVSGIAVNELILYYLYPHLGKVLSIIPAIEISIIYNFILNNRFTFKGKGMFLKRLGKYNFFNLVGYGVNLLIYYFAIFENVNIYVSDLMGILVAFVITYSTASLLVW